MSKEKKPEQPESLKIETTDGITYVTDKKDTLQLKKMLKSNASDEDWKEYSKQLAELMAQRDEILKREHTDEELKANWNNIRKLSKKFIAKVPPKRKPFLITHSSNFMLAFWKALLTPERKSDEVPISTATRNKDTWQIEWEKGEPSHEAKLIFFYCIAEYKRTKKTSIRINMKDWKNLRKNERDTRYKELVNEIDKLYAASAFWNTKKVRLLTGVDDPKEGRTTFIEIDIHGDLANIIIENKAFMYIHNALFSVNPKLNPHSIQLLINISSHMALNKTALLSTKWLISETGLPTAEEVKTKQGRHYKQKIIDPFERDMNALNILNWKFATGSNKSWKDFINSSIEITFNDPHPELVKIEQKIDGTSTQN